MSAAGKFVLSRLNGRWQQLALLAWVLGSLMGQLAWAQVPSMEMVPAEGNYMQELPFTDTYSSGHYSPESNTYFHLQHQEFEGFGDVPAFTGIGATHYAYRNGGVLLLELEGRITNIGGGGASGAVHRRYAHGETIFGAGAFYDLSQSENEFLYQQTGVSLEAMHGPWSLRANGYIPLGDRGHSITQADSILAGTFFYQGNNIVADAIAQQVEETSFGGVELELSQAIYSIDNELYIGYYHLQNESGVTADGFKGGFRGFVLPALAVNITISDDDVFGTNVYGGFTWYFGKGYNACTSGTNYGLLNRVERNRQVAVKEVITPVPTQVTLTFDDEVITVMHVNDDGAGGDGTFENPFGSLTDADNDPDKDDFDIVLVHSDTSFDNQSFTVSPEQRFLGEGDDNLHIIDTDQFGLIFLPEASDVSAPRPIIENTAGTAITLADDSIASNFTIDNATTALLANNLSGEININRIDITDGDTAIDIDMGDAEFSITGVNITDPATVAININGGSSEVTFGSDFVDQINGLFGASTIDQNENGSAVNVMGGHDGTFTMVAASSIAATDGNGLQFNNADGEYNFNGTVMLDGGDAGIDILGNSDGTFTFSSNTSIVNPTGDAFVVSGSGGSSPDIIYSGTIENDAGRAISISNTAEGNTIVFNSGAADAIGDSALGIRLMNVDQDVDFLADMELTGTQGIDIVSGSGTFTFSDTDLTDISAAPALSISGGTASVTFGGASSINQDENQAAVRVANHSTGTVEFNGSIAATDGTGLQFDNADGEYNFNGQVTLNGGDAGIDIFNGSDGEFTFANTDIINPTGDALVIDGGTADVSFGAGSSITQDENQIAVSIMNHSTGTIDYDGNIFATDGTGLQFDNADGTYRFDGFVSLNGGDAGVDIFNGSDGEFNFANTNITSPTGVALNIDGGSGDITFGGSIFKDNAGNAVEITGRSGGTVDINASVATQGTAGGIAIAGSTMDNTIRFDGAVDLGNAGNRITAATPLTIDNNGQAGAEVIFANLDIFTDGVLGMMASGGGTVEVSSGQINTIDQQALNLDGITSDISFTSINVTDSIGPAIDINDLAAGSEFSVNSTTVNGGTVAGIDVSNSQGTFTFSNIDIDDITGVGVRLVDNDTTAFNFNGGSIDGTTGDGINSTNTDNLTVSNLLIGQNSAVSGDGIDVVNNDATNRSVTITDNTITSNGNSLNIAKTGAGDLAANVSGNTLQSNATAGANIDGTAGAGTLFITRMNNNTVLGTAGGNGGIVVDTATFDALPGGAIETVIGGTTNIGTDVDRVQGVGLSLVNVTGALGISTLNSFTDGGPGLNVDTLATMFDLSINGGTIDTLGADAIVIDGVDDFALNNTAVENEVAFDTINGANSNVSGANNTATNFSSTDGGGNAGTISFNGGANMFP